jgi:hypothetical protein
MEKCYVSAYYTVFLYKIFGGELVSVLSLYKVRKVNELLCKCHLDPS